MRVLVKNGPLRLVVNLDAGDAWQLDELPDRARLTHRDGMRLELCATDLPSWPPSKIREHFTAPYRDDAIEIYHSSGLEGPEGEPLLYKLLYLPKGAQPPPDEALHTILDSVRTIPLDRITIVTEAS
jgi:hypothetical protein